MFKAYQEQVEASSSKHSGFLQETGESAASKHSHYSGGSADPRCYLEMAHLVEHNKGLSAASKLYESAIVASDGLDQREMSRKAQVYVKASQNEALDQPLRQLALKVAADFINLQHMPGTTRLQYAIALNNAAVDGQSAGNREQARALLKEAGKLDPALASLQIFQSVKEQIDQGQRIAEDVLKRITKH